ncbi:MAG: Ig-like domain-containing protein [Actinobacteria bacterium]|nr:Ig-like domain-containing protein [Actinomycetota bacterium]
MNKLNKFLLVIILIIVIIFIFTSIIFSILFQKPKKENISPTPFPIPDIEFRRNNQKLKIIEGSHTREDLYYISIVSPFTLIFNKPIEPSSIDFEIMPKVEIETELDSTQTKLTFKPKDVWEPNIIYVLNIKKAKAQDNSDLESIYQINFRSESKYDEENSSQSEVSNKRN